MAEAQVWKNATRNERLVADVEIKMRSKTLKTAASTTWLDELKAQRQRIQSGQQESIIMKWTGTQGNSAKQTTNSNEK